MVLNRLRLHGSQESTAGSISFILQLEYCHAQARPNLTKLRPGQTLALAEPEARHYNHPVTDIRPLLNRYPASAPRSKCLYWLYLSHFSTEWAEILHDCYLGGKDKVCRQNIDPAALLQYSMQHCSISNWTIIQPFPIGLRWNFWYD